MPTRDEIRETLTSLGVDPDTLESEYGITIEDAQQYAESNPLPSTTAIRGLLQSFIDRDVDVDADETPACCYVAGVWNRAVADMMAAIDHDDTDTVREIQADIGFALDWRHFEDKCGIELPPPVVSSFQYVENLDPNDADADEMRAAFNTLVDFLHQFDCT